MISTMCSIVGGKSAFQSELLFPANHECFKLESFALEEDSIHSSKDYYSVGKAGKHSSTMSTSIMEVS